MLSAMLMEALISEFKLTNPKRKRSLFCAEIWLVKRSTDKKNKMFYSSAATPNRFESKELKIILKISKMVQIATASVPSL